MDKKWVTLNVAGTYFTTGRITLAKYTPTNSPLHRISTNSTNVQWDRDSKGAYMIDRDPEYFRIILNYLRNRELVMDPETPELAILLEAEYYNIPELVRILNQRLQARYSLVYGRKPSPHYGSELGNSLFGQQICGQIEQI